MATYSATTPSAYRKSAVLTASNEQLVVLLYDGAHRFLIQAAAAMREGNLVALHQKLRRADAIISHLRTTLDKEQGGAIAQRLEEIYLFCGRHLSEARIKQDPALIDEVDALLLELRDAWSQVARG